MSAHVCHGVMRHQTHTENKWSIPCVPCEKYNHQLGCRCAVAFSSVRNSTGQIPQAKFHTFPSPYHRQTRSRCLLKDSVLVNLPIPSTPQNSPSVFEFFSNTDSKQNCIRLRSVSAVITSLAATGKCPVMHNRDTTLDTTHTQRPRV